jgi:hypothetical protein
MANIQTNIPLTEGHYYDFIYDGRHYTLQYSTRDEEGLHFDELADDIVWDFIIPPNRIETVVFSPEFEGHTDVEEGSQEGGKRKHNKRSKSMKKKSRKSMKTRKGMKSRKVRKNKK